MVDHLSFNDKLLSWVVPDMIVAGIPGVALVGWRTRPWMTIPAAVLYSLAHMRLFSMSVAFDYRHPIAVVLFAATLLYGTRQLKP
jgi:hypothetical protein